MEVQCELIGHCLQNISDSAVTFTDRVTVSKSAQVSDRKSNRLDVTASVSAYKENKKYANPIIIEEDRNWCCFSLTFISVN